MGEPNEAKWPFSPSADAEFEFHGPFLILNRWRLLTYDLAAFARTVSKASASESMIEDVDVLRGLVQEL